MPMFHFLVSYLLKEGYSHKCKWSSECEHTVENLFVLAANEYVIYCIV